MTDRYRPNCIAAAIQLFVALFITLLLIVPHNPQRRETLLALPSNRPPLNRLHPMALTCEHILHRCDKATVNLSSITSSVFASVFTPSSGLTVMCCGALLSISTFPNRKLTQRNAKSYSHKPQTSLNVIAFVQVS